MVSLSIRICAAYAAGLLGLLFATGLASPAQGQDPGSAARMACEQAAGARLQQDGSDTPSLRFNTPRLRAGSQEEIGITGTGEVRSRTFGYSCIYNLGLGVATVTELVMGYVPGERPLVGSGGFRR